MAHALRFSFTMDGHPLSIKLLDGSAVGFAGDVDVFARSTGLDLAIPSEFDRQHFHQVLSGTPLTLVADLDQGELVYRCTSHARLPRGRYEWRLSVAGLHAGNRPHQHFDVPTDGDGEIKIEAPFFSDVRRVSLSKPPTEFDDLTRRLVFAEDSRIDRIRAADWLTQPNVAPQRKALVLNILAKLRCSPSPDASLIRHVEAILGAQEDRVYLRFTPDVVGEFGSFVSTDSFREERTPLAPIHQRLPGWVLSRLDPQTASAMIFGRLLSFRQAVTSESLQVVLAPTETNSPGGNARVTGPCYADLDVDIGGSLTDLVGFIKHVGELVGGSLTDHVKLFDDLKHDNVLRPFLYYTVETGV